MAAYGHWKADEPLAARSDSGAEKDTYAASIQEIKVKKKGYLAGEYFQGFNNLDDF